MDKELEQYRSLMEVPSTFEEGFTWTALIGATFIALLMVPGAMYMGLLAGGGISSQWVTVILFLEVARRAHKQIKRPELFVLFYMSAAAMGNPFGGLLWSQFFVRSQAVAGAGLSDYISQVYWLAPTDPSVLDQRNFFNPAWYPAIGMVLFSTIVGRVGGISLTYGLFRLASDIEKLPFPMAPIGAQGIMALVEQQSEEGTKRDVKEGWRWRIFSMGGVLGMTFAAIYTALPAITGALFGTPIQILPIPFVDLTPKTADILPAVATGITFDMGVFMVGLVLPFYAMLGSFLAMIATCIANPILRAAGLLPTWRPGDSTIKTQFENNLDFYFSFQIGIALAVAAVGIWQVWRSLKLRRKETLAQQATLAQQQETGLADQHTADLAGPPQTQGSKRGDINFKFILGVYFLTSLSYILVSGYLIDWDPRVMVVLVFFAYIYTPLVSYVTTRLEGMAGQSVQIPMVREAAFLLSGFQGIKIWFLPIPMADYGSGTVFYRQAELTGTKLWSIWKAEIVLVPIVLVASIMFAQFIWSLAPIPGPDYPFAQMMWELNAANQCIIYTSTLGKFSQFQEAFNPTYLAAGSAIGVSLFALLWSFNVPVMFVYGVIGGLGQSMHSILPQFLGACLARFHFERRMGMKWRQYAPVVTAGFGCGAGLMTMLAVGFNFLTKSVIKIPF